MVYSVVGVTLFCSVFYSCWLHFSGEVLFLTFFFLILSFILYLLDFIMIKQRQGSPLRILLLVCCHRSRLLLQIVLISVILLQSCSCSSSLNQIATRIAQHSSCTLVANKDYSFGFQNGSFIFRKLYFSWYFGGHPPTSGMLHFL